MVTCEDCRREMKLAASCDIRLIKLRGEWYRLDPYLPPPDTPDPTARCGDCGVRPGGNHHLGCDMVECPRCGGQLIGCGCWDEDTLAATG